MFEKYLLSNYASKKSKVKIREKLLHLRSICKNTLKNGFN